MNTTSTATKSTPKAHIDGGTYTNIAFAETRNRWGIAITEWTTYRGQTVFEIHRVSNDNKMLVIARCNTETAARARANTAWLAER
jgi:hypothetical protein